MPSELLLQNLTFGYDALPEPLFRDLTLHVPAGWTGVVGANGSGKTTLLLLAASVLRPGSGAVRAPRPALYCPQRTDDPPSELEEFLRAEEADAACLRGRLGVQPDWPHRWATLSHGERKRAQIAKALWQRPALLAVDEPTNHLDAQASDLLALELGAYRGVGLLVSHDRELLDRLCVRCLFLDPPSVVLRPGGYTSGSSQAALERKAGRALYLQTRRRAEAAHREAGRRRDAASRADRLRSKRKLGIHDSDAKEKIDRARVSGKDGRAGRLARQMEARERRAGELARARYVPPERRLRFWLPGERCPGDHVARLPAGRLALGGERMLRHPDLSIGPADRIAIVGPNGSGKSTLFGRLLRVATVARERLVVMEQEIIIDRCRALAAEVAALDGARRGHLLTVVAGLGSAPERLLGTELPSPGETRKLLLALGVVRDPWLIAMDEPTNHLDLPSIELMENALAGSPCALLLVSHDLRFLEALGCRIWRTHPEDSGYCLVT